MSLKYLSQYKTYNNRGYCGKICFSKRDAQTKKNWLEKTGKEKALRIYPCHRCSAWHLTSSV